jgi:hypothetical protein
MKIGFWAPSTDTPEYATATDKLVSYARYAIATVALDYPDVRDCIDREWDRRERDMVLAYVTNHSFKGMAFMGHSTCRCCGQRNGNRDYADDTYVWPEGLGHYIREHGVKPPQHFIDHVFLSQ